MCRYKSNAGSLLPRKLISLNMTFPVLVERAVSKIATDRIIERLRKKLSILRTRKFIVNSEAKRRIHMMTSTIVVKCLLQIIMEGDPSVENVRLEDVERLFDVLSAARGTVARAA